jgi:UDP-2,3-diacylglucosamine pyrophosphatase LpxH
MGKLKFFISDLHLSVRNGSDDFDGDKEARFVKFLEKVHEEARICPQADDCELIVLGDFPDLLEVTPRISGTPEAVNEDIIAQVVAAHPAVFGGLRGYLAHGHKLFYVVGNHDRGLCYSEALDRHLIPPCGSAGAYRPGNFMRASHYFSDALGIYADHGHYKDPFNLPANGAGDTMVRDVLRPIEDGLWHDELTDSGRAASLSDLSFMRNVPPHLAGTPVLRIVDNLRPNISVLWYMWQLKSAGYLSAGGYTRFIQELLQVAGLPGFVKSVLGAVLTKLLKSGPTVKTVTAIADYFGEQPRGQARHAEEMRRRMLKLWGMDVKSVVAGHTHVAGTGTPLKGKGMFYNAGAWRDTFALMPDGTFLWSPGSSGYCGVARDNEQVTVAAVKDDGSLEDKTVELERFHAEVFGV